MKRIITGLALCLTLTTQLAIGIEKEIGKAVVKNGMNIGAVYLQAVLMKPEHKGSDNPADIHLEADISAAKGGGSGFDDDAWIPYLGLKFEISKNGSPWTKNGTFIPMLANDGPHYGANIKMDGAGKYHVKYTISPPSHHGFHRHVDKETGVSAWWKPFSLEWDFIYLGVGKKGGY